MNRKISKSIHFILALFTSIAYWGCSPDDTTDYSPVIGLEEVELVKTEDGFDSLMYIHFWYEDKDGDIGLDDSDTLPPFRGVNNLIIDFQEKTNGQYQPLTIKNTNIPVDFDQRIPSLTPSGKNKEISGSMSISFGVDANEIHADTVSFQLYIVDRAFNESNIIDVSDLALKQK